MVKEGIVLGHRISEKGIEVDRAKLEVVVRLPPPISVKVWDVFWDIRVLIDELLRISKNFYILYAIYFRRNENFILMNLV